MEDWLRHVFQPLSNRILRNPGKILVEDDEGASSCGESLPETNVELVAMEAESSSPRCPRRKKTGISRAEDDSPPALSSSRERSKDPRARRQLVSP
jgi:hypothetical protein